jgi:uncharacterized RDD family membrane protein YckC
MPAYAGLATRAVAFVTDAAIINGVALLVVGATSLVLSIFGRDIGDLPSAVAVIFGVAGWIALNVFYFVGCWTLTGQTAGMRLLSIRVTAADGKRLHVVRGVMRLIGIVLAAVPLFAGYLPILVSDRRRGLQDWLANSVVVFSYEQDAPWGGPLSRRLARERRRQAVAEQPRELPAPAISPRTDDVTWAARNRIEESPTNGGIDGSARRRTGTDRHRGDRLPG